MKYNNNAPSYEETIIVSDWTENPYDSLDTSGKLKELKESAIQTTSQSKSKRRCLKTTVVIILGLACAAVALSIKQEIGIRLIVEFKLINISFLFYKHVHVFNIDIFACDDFHLLMNAF